MQKAENRRQTTDNKTGGFTLIETIITIVVLSIAMGGVLSVFIAGMRGSADPLIINQAVSLAQKKMDEAIAVKKSGGFAAVTTLAPVAFPVPYNAYSWSRLVDCDPTFAPCPSAEYKRVTITVSWDAGADSLSLVTLFTNY